jgi:heme exporter protein A
MTRTVAEARRLGLSFGSRPVLRELAMRVDSGQAVAIIGANGSGKSTLLKILAGLLAPTAGLALVFGEDCRRLAPANRRRIGFLSHQSLLYPNLTAHENLEFYARLYGLGRPRSVAAQVLEEAGLGQSAGQRLGTFSRGMEQRLALARTTLARPDLLLLDEPFAALDRDGAEFAARTIGAALRRGAAVVLTAHGRDEVDELGADCLQLERGRLGASQYPGSDASGNPVAACGASR